MSIESEYSYYPERIGEVLKEHGLLAEFEAPEFVEFVRNH